MSVWAGIIATAITAVAGLAGIILTTRQSKKKGDLEAKVALEAAQAARDQKRYDDMQEELTEAKAEPAKLRLEIKQAWADVSALRAETEKQLAEMRAQHAEQIRVIRAETDAVRVSAIAHIRVLNAEVVRLGGTAPAMPNF